MSVRGGCTAPSDQRDLFTTGLAVSPIEKYNLHAPPETVKAKFEMRPACEGEISRSIKTKEVAVMTTLVRIRMKADTQLYTIVL